MPRDIDEFKDDGLIVGGWWSIPHQKNNQYSIRNSNNFYTLDNDRNPLPDLNLDFKCAVVREVLPPKCFINTKQLLKDNGVLIYKVEARPTDLKIPE